MQIRIGGSARAGRRPWLLALGLTVLLGSGTACSGAGGADGANAGNVVLVTAVRSLSNPYEAQWVQGAQWYADSLKLPLKTIVYNADSQTELSDINALLATGKTIVMDINVNASADTQAIARAVTKAGGYVVTEWNSPPSLHPWDVGNHWVAHVSYDGVPGGANAANVLFSALGNQGGIIALQGIADNTPAIQRKQGLDQALAKNPGITLLSSQIANWDQTTAYNQTKTLLTKYGSAIKGVWSANDDMAIGAEQALSQANRTDVKIVSASDATPQVLKEIATGDQMLATYSTNSYYDGAIGLVLAYQAATGKIDTGALPHSKRDFYIQEGSVTKANVQQFLSPPPVASFLAELKDPFARYAGPLNP